MMLKDARPKVLVNKSFKSLTFQHLHSTFMFYLIRDLNASINFLET